MILIHSIITIQYFYKNLTVKLSNSDSWMAKIKFYGTNLMNIKLDFIIKYILL